MREKNEESNGNKDAEGSGKRVDSRAVFRDCGLPKLQTHFQAINFTGSQSKEGIVPITSHFFPYLITLNSNGGGANSANKSF